MSIWNNQLIDEWLPVLDIIDDESNELEHGLITAAYRRKPYDGPMRYFGPPRLIRFLNSPTIVGNTMKIKKDLPSFGFRWDGNVKIDGTQLGDATSTDNVINGAMIGTRELSTEEISRLASIGVDISMQSTEFHPFIQQLPVAEISGETPAPTVQQGAQSDIANIEMIKKLRDAASITEKGKVIEDQVKKLIGLLSNPNITEEQSKLKEKFLKFMSSSHNYSFYNSILIFMQNSNATLVGGAKNFWNKKGYSLNSDAQPIWILAPIIVPKKVTTQEYAMMAHDLKRKGVPDNEIKEQMKKQLGRMGQLIGFKDVPVYDASQASPIPGWTDEKGNPPFNLSEFHLSYRNKTNTPDEYADTLFFATKAAAEKMNIKVGSDTTGFSGGYSSGGQIVLDKNSVGERRVATMFHEFAHEILHQGEENRKKRREEQTDKRIIELEAESTAFLLTQAFDIKGDPEWAARYILLWDNKPEDVMSRQQNIHFAYKKIFEAIKKQLDDIIEKQSEKSWKYVYTKNSWTYQY